MLDRGLRAAAADPSGITGAALVVLLAWVLTRLFWTPLSWPAAAVNSVIATFTPASCAMFGPPNLISDNVCGTVIALLTVIGALAATLGLMLIRMPLRRMFTAIVGAGVGPGHFLVTPLTATLLFTAGWAGVEYHFPVPRAPGDRNLVVRNVRLGGGLPGVEWSNGDRASLRVLVAALYQNEPTLEHVLRS